MLDGIYLAEIARARTDNLIQQVHIAFENEITPLEFERLARDLEASGAALPRVSRDWIVHMRHLLRSGITGARPFVRQPCAPGAFLYLAPPGLPVAPRRTLIVLFTGDAHRPMIPIAGFLQHCDPSRHELLLLIDPTRSFFLRGIPGIAPDFPSLLRWVDRQREARAAARTLTLGVSAGGLAAVWAAVELGLERCISIGGTCPEQVAQRHGTRDVDVSGFDDAIRRRAGALPETVFVYGDRCERDRAKRVLLASHLPVTPVTVPHVAEHNVIHAALRRGRLASLIELVTGERPVAEAMRDPAAWHGPDAGRGP